MVSIWSGGGWQSVRNVILAVLSVNLVTHTVFWYTLPLLPGEATMRLLAYEIAIVMIEGLAYAYFLHFRLWSSLLLSGCLNWLSYTLGVLIWQRLWHV